MIREGKGFSIYVVNESRMVGLDTNLWVQIQLFEDPGCREGYFQINIKRTVSRDGYFFKVKTLNRTFCVCADGFQGLLKAFHYPIQLLTFYLIL